MMTGSSTIYEYLQVLSSKEAIPGGGGVSALACALGNSMGQMVANLTIGKEKYAQVEVQMHQWLNTLQLKQKHFLELADADANVFLELMKVYRRVTQTEAEAMKKEADLQVQLEQASFVPLEVMEGCKEMLAIMEGLAKEGNAMAVSDIGVGVQLLRAGILGASMNVFINTKLMKDRKKAQELNGKADEFVAFATSKADEIYQQIWIKLRR